MFEYNYKNKFSVSHNTKIIPNRGTYEQQKNRTWLGQLPIKAQCIIDLVHYYTTSMATLLLYKLATNAIHWGSHVPPAANTFLAPHFIGLISMAPRTPCRVSCWRLQLLYSYISAKALFFFFWRDRKGSLWLTSLQCFYYMGTNLYCTTLFMVMI
jgi:hypothetical protein